MAHIYDYGYAIVQDVYIYLKNICSRGTSEHGTKTLIENFLEQDLVGFKELPDKQKIYFLKNKGVQASGRDASYNHRIQKNLNIKHIEHFWIAKKFEDALQQDTEKYETYYAETLNEFVDMEGKLSVKDCNLRSDAEIIFKKNFHERLVLRVEIDMGTQSISTVLKGKFNNYLKYYKSARINDEYETFPIFVLFVTNRREAIVDKLKNHEVMPYILFLPMSRFRHFMVDAKFKKHLDEQRCNSEFRTEIRRSSKKGAKRSHVLSTNVTVHILEEGKKWVIQDENLRLQIMNYSQKYLVVQDITDVFCSHTMTNQQGKYFSFQTLIEEREPLLRFKNTIEVASKAQYAFKVVCKTIYSTNYKKDPFFPAFIYVNQVHTKFQPHGYFKMRKKLPDTLRDSLFVLVYIMGTESEILKLYEIFLSTKSHMEKMNALPIYYGLLILIPRELHKQVELIIAPFAFLQECVRIVYLEDCTEENLFSRDVWRDLEGEAVALIDKKREKQMV